MEIDCIKLGEDLFDVKRFVEMVDCKDLDFVTLFVVGMMVGCMGFAVVQFVVAYFGVEVVDCMEQVVVAHLTIRVVILVSLEREYKASAGE